MNLIAHMPDVASVIHTAIAPVFLLTGVGALLSVLTSRLGRIIDHARKWEERLPSLQGDAEQLANFRLRTLSQRARLINRAISLAVSCALLICVVIVALFLTAFYVKDLDRTIAWIFITAMLALIGSLLTFLREVYVATASLRIGTQ